MTDEKIQEAEKKDMKEQKLEHLKKSFAVAKKELKQENCKPFRLEEI